MTISIENIDEKFKITRDKEIIFIDRNLSNFSSKDFLLFLFKFCKTDQVENKVAKNTEQTLESDLDIDRKASVLEKTIIKFLSGMNDK